MQEDAGRQDVRLAQIMDSGEGSTESKAQHLIDAIEQVGDGVWKVEVWAGALLKFASPVPFYEPGDWHRLPAPFAAPVPAE